MRGTVRRPSVFQRKTDGRCASSTLRPAPPEPDPPTAKKRVPVPPGQPAAQTETAPKPTHAQQDDLTSDDNRGRSWLANSAARSPWVGPAAARGPPARSAFVWSKAPATPCREPSPSTRPTNSYQIAIHPERPVGFLGNGHRWPKSTPIAAAWATPSRAQNESPTPSDGVCGRRTP